MGIGRMKTIYLDFPEDLPDHSAYTSRMRIEREKGLCSIIHYWRGDSHRNWFEGIFLSKKDNGNINVILREDDDFPQSPSSTNIELSKEEINFIKEWMTEVTK